VPDFRQTAREQDLLEAKYHENDDEDVSLSENKKPKWDRKRECFVLDFKKRATEASVKNFLLVTDEDPEHDSVLFGKRGKDEFNLDVQYPMSLFQAFAIALSAIYSKSAPMFS
jgi:tubby-related protein 1